MAIKKEIINFTLQNTLSATMPVSIFGNMANLQDNGNATTEYSWNVTTLVVTTENTIELQYAAAGSPTFSTVTVPFSGTTYQDIVNALNTLNLGGFALIFQLGNWYIVNYSMNYQFGYLNIYDPAVVPTTFAGAMTAAGDTLAFDINLVNQVTFVGVAPISGTYNAAVADNLTISGTSGAIGFSLKVTQYPDNIILFTVVLPPATPYIFNWVAQSTKQYEVFAS